MSHFNYKQAQLELNRRIERGEVPEGAIAVSGYGFGFKPGNADLLYVERQGPRGDWQDLLRVGGRWFFVHVLQPSFSEAASHYKSTVYANRGEADDWDIKRYGLE